MMYAMLSIHKKHSRFWPTSRASLLNEMRTSSRSSSYKCRWGTPLGHSTIPRPLKRPHRTPLGESLGLRTQRSTCQLSLGAPLGQSLGLYTQRSSCQGSLGSLLLITARARHERLRLLASLGGLGPCQAPLLMCLSLIFAGLHV